MRARKQSTTSYPIPFFMVSSSDKITPATGLAPTVTLSKNGGLFVSANGLVSEIGQGWYTLAGDSADRDTLGDLVVHAEATGAEPFDGLFLIVAYDPFDPVRMGMTSLPNASAGAQGGLLVNDSIAGSVNDLSATATSFNCGSALSTTASFYNGSVIVFTSGTLRGLARKIGTYAGGTNRTVTVSTAFPSAPANGDTFFILGRIE